MERLTKLATVKNGNKYTSAIGSGVGVWPRIIQRLAEYEDTGLTPEEVQHIKLYAMGNAVAEIQEFDGVTIDLLKALAASAKEGRLLVLPCPIGTPVYVHEPICKEGKRITYKGCKYGQDCAHMWGFECPVRVVKRAFTVNMRNGLGKTFWLTREDAEAAAPTNRREKPAGQVSEKALQALERMGAQAHSGEG